MAAGFGGNDAAELRPHTARDSISAAARHVQWRVLRSSSSALSGNGQRRDRARNTPLNKVGAIDRFKNWRQIPAFLIADFYNRIGTKRTSLALPQYLLSEVKRASSDMKGNVRL
jgi:hypothetical protein